MEGTTRRGFLQKTIKTGLLAGELAVIGGGIYTLGRKAYRAVLTMGTTDQRFSPTATLPQVEQQAIPFTDVRDGETLLGKRITFPLPGNQTIDMELGFVSTTVGRDLRFRIPPKVFRITDDFHSVVVGRYVLDVLRENREAIRIASEHGAALIEVTRCAAIAKTLREARERLIVITDVPFEIRSPWREAMTYDVHFERTDE